MFETTFETEALSPDDLAGNNDIGRYIFLINSDARAKQLAENFDDVAIKSYQHELQFYSGSLKNNRKKIDVAVISSGTSCANMEKIVHELFVLGAKRFLHIGTAHTLQPQLISAGNLINVQACVRDEGTTQRYAPKEFPAVASLEFMTSILVAAEKLQCEHLHTGIVHCKDAFFANEFSPLAIDNQNYFKLLVQSGVLASEMQTASLLIQSQIYNYQLMQEGNGPAFHVLAGAILAVIDNTLRASAATHDALELGIEAVKVLAAQELFF